MPSYVTPKKNTAYIIYTALVSQADTKLLKSGPTLAAGDFKVSTDGGAFANLATLPTNTPSGVLLKISLSAGEMNGDNISIACIDAAGAEWCDQLINIQTSAQQIDDIPTANANADALLDRAAGVETGITPRQGLRLMLATLVGKLSGAATATVSIRDTNDAKNRVVATVDANGNRSAVTLDAS